MLLQILIDNPLLTFCIVAALGYLLGRVRIGGSSLGTAAVLFAGLFVGAIDPRLKLPDALYLRTGPNRGGIDEAARSGGNACPNAQWRSHQRN